MKDKLKNFLSHPSWQGVAGIIAIIALFSTPFYIPSCENGANNRWSVEQFNYPAVLVDSSPNFVKAKVCYKNGTVDWVGIDNSNRIDPRKGNFIALNKGMCAEYGIESGPNLAVFLPLGKKGKAYGTYEIFN